jgi:hypothetical protein
VDESVEPDETSDQPPNAVNVARRALILSAVVWRASIESYTDESYKRETAKHVHDWLDELKLSPHLEPEEEKILRTPFGKMPRQVGVRGSWFVEGLAILAWALQRGDFPSHDREVDPIAVTNDLDFLHPDAEQLLEKPKLRDATQLQAAREWFYDLHCTLRGFLFHNGDGYLAEWIGQYLQTLAIDPKQVKDGRSLTICWLATLRGGARAFGGVGTHDL